MFFAELFKAPVRALLFKPVAVVALIVQFFAAQHCKDFCYVNIIRTAANLLKGELGRELFFQAVFLLFGHAPDQKGLSLLF